MRTPSFLAIVLMMACGPANIAGKVDGDKVAGATAAVYDDLEVDLGIVDWTAASVMVSSFPETCDVVDLALELELDCEQRCEDLVDMAAEHSLGEREWTLTLTLVADNDLEETYDFDSAPEDDEFNSVFSWWDTAPLRDQDLCEEACEAGELLDSSSDNAVGGEVVVHGLDDQILTGQFDVDFPGNDSLKGSFRADHCDMTSWLLFR